MYIGNGIYGNTKNQKLSTLINLAKNTLNITFPRFHSNPKRSLLIFSEDNFMRKVAKKIIDSNAFELIIQITIVVNCAVLAMESHYYNNDKTHLDEKLDMAELFFLIMFTLEAAVKILASGFAVGPKTYLKNPWNILDFIVISVGIIGSMFHNFDQRVVGALRALRPLKLIYNFNKLEIVMKSLLKAMQPLLQIGILIFFIIIMYAIIGLEFFSGKFHFACFPRVITRDPQSRLPAPQQPCSPFNDSAGSYQCPPNYVCRTYWNGPNYGVTNFDNIIFSMLTVFQCFTMEGWTDVLYMTNKATGTQYNSVYYVSLVLIGSFFMLNLVLGVLSGEFAKERERVEKRNQFIDQRKELMIKEELEGYLDWMEFSDELRLADPDVSKRERKHIIRARLRAERIRLNKVGHLEEGEEELERKWKRNLRKINQCGPGFCLTCRVGVEVVRVNLQIMLKHQAFFWLVNVLVILNVFLISLEHYNQPQYLSDLLTASEYIFLTIFVFEMLMKMFAFGIKRYFKGNFNILDFAVIIFSSMELVWQYYKQDSSFGIIALRSVRILRLFKVTRYWTSMRNLVQSLLNSLISVFSLLFLLFLFLFIFAILGMQIFGGWYNFDDNTPDQNFDTFFDALLSVFEILTGENWNEAMYNGIRSQSTRGSSSQIAMLYSIYFVVIVIFGNYTLLNIFLAIAVDNLGNAQLMDQEDEEKTAAKKALEDEANENEIEKEDLKFLLGRSVEVPPLQIIPVDDDNCSDWSLHYRFKSIMEEVEATCETFKTGEFVDGHLKEGTRPINQYSSLYMFEPSSFVRRLAHFIVNLEHFETFIILAIVASSLALAAEDVVNEKAPINKYFKYLDYIFTGVFAIECLLKIIDMGFIFHPGSYLRSVWNAIDLVVVISSLLYLTIQTNRSAMKSLRVIRVFRPLKSVQRIKKLKEVFETVMQSIKNVINILVVYLLFHYIFAVMAVQLFRGKFFHCTDPSRRTYETCQGHFIDYSEGIGQPTVQPRQWLRYCFHYDDVFHSFVTLYTVTTSEGWISVLRHSMDATHINMGPIFNFRREMAIFYIVFFIIFPFFFVNIFVALIIITFQEEGQKKNSDLGIDKNQKLCLDFAVAAQPRTRYIPSKKSSIQYCIWRLVVSTPFEILILIMIVLNTVVLMLRFYQREQYHFPLLMVNISDDTDAEVVATQYNESLINTKIILERIINYNNYHEALQYLNYGFITLFTVEALLKIIGLNPKNYFMDFWNTFDFVTVIGSISDVLITSVKSEGLIRGVPNIGFLRLFRAARLMKLLRQINGIRIILWTFVQSFKSLPYVVLLIFIIFFIYGIIGMQLFGNIKLATLDTPTSSDSSIGQMMLYNNFQSILNAMLLLFRCVTGENWQLIMLACEYGQPCACSQPPCSGEAICGNNGAYLYFISFSYLTTLLMFNLFIAVLMENFEYLTRDISILGPHHLDEYIEKWSHYDPEATGEIHYTEVYDLLMKIEPPVGFGKKCPYRLAYKKLIRMNMPVSDKGKVHFTTTLVALIREALSLKKGPTDESYVLDMELRWCIARMWPKVAKKKMNLLVPREQDLIYPHLTVGKIYTCLWIYENWMAFKAATGGRRHRTGHCVTLDNDLVGFAESRTKFETNVQIHRSRPVAYRAVALNNQARQSGKFERKTGKQLKIMLCQQLARYLRHTFRQVPRPIKPVPISLGKNDADFPASFSVGSSRQNNENNLNRATSATSSTSSQHMATIVTELCKKYKFEIVPVSRAQSHRYP